jgi:hypothetical protein
MDWEAFIKTPPCEGLYTILENTKSFEIPLFHYFETRASDGVYMPKEVLLTRHRFE